MEHMKNSVAEGIRHLREGRSPGNPELLKEIMTGLDSLTGFLSRQYLDEYIPAGGSKIKFVTGLKGSGKTALAECLLAEAAGKNYRTVRISAKQLWLYDFREVYLEILRQCDLKALLRDCAGEIMREMGYEPEKIPAGKSLMDILSEKGEGDAFSRSEIRDALRRRFTRNPLLDNSFAVCCSLLAGDILGYPILEESSRELLLGFMQGDKSVRLSQLKALGITPSRVTKYNARHLLRSLCELISICGHPGLMVVIDDLEQLISRSAEDMIRYSKGRREDCYESIRQLIDDIDSMGHVLFLFCLDRELAEDDSRGLKSYQALWLRIQNEVVSPRFNRFADMVDLDRYGDEFYHEDVMVEMSARLARLMNAQGVHAGSIGREEAAQLKERALFGRLGIPYLVGRLTLEKGEGHG